VTWRKKLVYVRRMVSRPTEVVVMSIRDASTAGVVVKKPTP
jgi:hypothetical protein